ncbi:MAG: YdcF family protein [Cyclobacteriaceae bacterium]
MFFFLSKTIGYLIRPLLVVTLLFLLHFMVKKESLKKWSLYSALLLLFIFSNSFISNEAIRLFEASPIPISDLSKRSGPYEWGILLTGVTSGNRELKDRVYINTNADRVNHTVMLYQKGLIKRILVSGGTGKLINPDHIEAVELKKVFVYMGVRESDLLIEGESRNTHESAVAVSRILKNEKAGNCLLITSASHIPRAIGCFRNEGLACDVFPTDMRFHERQFTPDELLIPGTDALLTWEEIFKETAGLIAYKIAGYI